MAALLQQNQLSFETVGTDSSIAEVRGCLFKSVLDMRKRSLIRSGSEDSGFPFDSYESLVSSFDAEKFLEDMGFAGATQPLIPDRFIPSLIHRISALPDETMKQLDERVWRSIESFKNKEQSLWFFTNSCVECDLCLNNNQRAHSLPAVFSQGFCDPFYQDNTFPLTTSNSNEARVQKWLSRFSSVPLGYEENSNLSVKSNIAHIGNQSSTESGILSAVEDDVFTTSTTLEDDDRNDVCSPSDWVTVLQPQQPETSDSLEKGRISEVTDRAEALVSPKQSSEELSTDGQPDFTSPGLGLNDVEQEVDLPSSPVSPPKSSPPDLSGVGFTFQSRKKRHSFDAAYASTAAEKRQRFKLSHTRSHNFLFQTTRDNSRGDSDASVTTRPTWRAVQSGSWYNPNQYEDNEGNSCETSPAGNTSEDPTTCMVLTRTNSESSEQYFSCDDVFPENLEVTPEEFIGIAEDSDSNHDNFASFDSTSSAEQEIVPLPTFPKGKSSLQGCYKNMSAPNRIFFVTGKENFVLNKVLTHNLNNSLVNPTSTEAKHFMLGNELFQKEKQPFSEVQSSGDTLVKTNAVVENIQSSASTALICDVPAVKSVGTIACDNSAAEDNRLSISNPYVRNLSLSEMSLPKGQVQVVNYDGWALFWSSRKAPKNDRKPSLKIKDSLHLDTDLPSQQKFTSGIRMAVNSDAETGSAANNNKTYFSEVCLVVNSEEDDQQLKNKRIERNFANGELPTGKYVSQNAQNESPKNVQTLLNAENPCGRARRDLEDLRTAIRKAKETRISASKELKLLQELLQGSDNEEDETRPTRTNKIVIVEEPILSSPVNKAVNGNLKDALGELQQKSENDTLQSKEFWEEQIRKEKEKISQVCQEKLSIMEQKLRTTEEELSKVLEENSKLKVQLELSSTALPTCKCNAVVHNADYSHMNGITHEDSKTKREPMKPSLPTKDFWKEWDRLQRELMKAERRADDLNLLLNQKLVELNKMQLTLAKQTRELFFMEKAYFELRSHLSKRRFNKAAALSRLSSSLASVSPTEKSSEDSSKASDPEIPP